MSSLLNDRAFMRHFEKSKVEAKQQMNCLIDGIYANLLVDLLQWHDKDNRNDDDELVNVANEPNLPFIENSLEVNPNDVSGRVFTNEVNKVNCFSSSLSNCSPSNSTNEHLEPNLAFNKNSLEVNLNDVRDLVCITNETNKSNSPSSSLSNCSPSNLSINDVNIKSEIIDNFTSNAETQDDSSQSSIIVVFDSRDAQCLPKSSSDELLNQNTEISDNQTTSQNESQTNETNEANETNETNESNYPPPSPSLSNCSPSNLSINNMNIKSEINDNLEQSSAILEGITQSLIVHPNGGKDCGCVDCLPTSSNDELLNRNNENNEIDDNQTTSKNESQIEGSNIDVDKHADDYEDEDEEGSDEAFEPDYDELDESESESESSVDEIQKKRARIQNSDQLTTEQQQHKCPQCSKQFSNSDQLQVHLEVHDLNSSDSDNNNNNRTPFQCEHCGVRFNQQGKLNQHLVKHSDERPFPCDQCGRRFKRKKNLKSHTKTHNWNELPSDRLECNVNLMEMQNRREESSSTLRPTMAATVEKPFRCHYCTISFLSEDTQNRHEIFIHNQQIGK